MELIEKLYDIYSESKKEPSYDRKNIAGLKYNSLKEKLPEDLAAELDSLMNETMVLNLEELKTSFKKGFCMGIELLTEVKKTNWNNSGLEK